MNELGSMILIRHAQTDLAGTFCGHTDPPVNATGRAQIEALLEGFAPGSIDMVYTSDLRRACSTAIALARQVRCNVAATAGLREICFGAWEGLTWAEIEGRDAGFARRWADEFPRIAAPGAERYESFSRRVDAELARIEKMAKGRRVAVVTHGGVMRVALKARCRLSEQETWERTQAYCCRYDVKVRV